MQTPIPFPNPLTASTYLTSSGRSWKRMVVAFALIVTSLASISATPGSAAARVTVNGAGDLVVTATNVTETITVSGGHQNQITVKVQTQNSETTHHFDGIARDLVINSRRGNDALRLDGIEVPRDLRVNAGSGTNLLSVINSSIGRDVRTIDGPGAMVISFINVDVERNGRFTLGSGVHRIDFLRSRWVGSHRVAASGAGRIDMRLSDTDINGPFTVIGGNQSDRVQVVDATQLAHNATFDLRGGHDMLIFDEAYTTNASRLLRVKAGSGDDAVFFRNGRLAGSFNIDLGRNDDRGGMTNMYLDSPGIVNGGPGQDRYPMQAVIGGPTTFRSIEIGVGTIEL